MDPRLTAKLKAVREVQDYATNGLAKELKQKYHPSVPMDDGCEDPEVAMLKSAEVGDEVDPDPEALLGGLDETALAALLEEQAG